MKISLLLTLSLLGLAAAAPAENRKPAAAPPASQTAPAPKKEGFMKKLWPFGGEPKPAVEAKPAPGPKKDGFMKKLWPFGGEPKPAAPAKPAPAPGPEKEGFIKKLWPFGGEPEPKLATVPKTKTSAADSFKPIKLDIKAPQPPTADAPPEPKQPGFFGKLFAPVEDRNDDMATAEESEKPLLPADWETKAIITQQDAEAYLYGPAQATADAKLRKGTVVAMRTRGKHWSEVTLDDGRTLTVSSDEVRMAQKEDFREPPPPPVLAVAPPLPEFYAPLPDTSNVPEKGAAELPLSSGELLLIPAKQ